MFEKPSHHGKKTDIVAPPNGRQIKCLNKLKDHLFWM